MRRTCSRCVRGPPHANRQQRDAIAVALAIAYDQLTETEVDVLDPQPRALEQPKSGAVEQIGHQCGHARHSREHRAHFVAREHDRQPLPPNGACHRLYPRWVDVQDLCVEEMECAQSLVGDSTRRAFAVSARPETASARTRPAWRGVGDRGRRCIARANSRRRVPFAGCNGAGAARSETVRTVPPTHRDARSRVRVRSRVEIGCVNFATVWHLQPPRHRARAASEDDRLSFTFS